MVGENPVIIVVDDDPSMSQAIVRLLTTSGWTSLCCNSAEELLEKDAAGKAALLILDIQLPGMSGFELRRHLAASGIAPPVIFITGYDRPWFRTEAADAGAAYLPKPFQGHLLIEEVRRCLPAALS